MTSNSDLKRRTLEIIKRHEAVEEAKEDLKAAYDAAESVGFTKAALKRAVKKHRMTPEKRAKLEQAEQDEQLYLFEIEGPRIEMAKTITEASVAYLHQSRKIRSAAE